MSDSMAPWDECWLGIGEFFGDEGGLFIGPKDGIVLWWFVRRWGGLIIAELEIFGSGR